MNPEVLEQLSADSSCWKRCGWGRGDGDSWSICPVTVCTTLVVRHFQDPVGDTVEDEEIPRYLALHIKIDGGQWCPDNLLYEVRCMDTIDAAVGYLAGEVVTGPKTSTTLRG